MRSVTLHIPKRGNPNDDYVVEVYRWRDGKIEQSSSGSIPLKKELFLEGGTLDVKQVKELILNQEGDSEGFDKYGRELYDAINKGKVSQVLQKERGEAEAEIKSWTIANEAIRKSTPRPSGLRLYVAVEDEALLAIPWELLRSNFPLFLQEEFPVLRCESKDLVPRESSAVWPIRILVIEGCSGPVAEEIGASEEIDGIREALRPADYLFETKILRTRRLRPETLNPCTPARLSEELKRFKPHVLHFIGHGRITAGNAVLEICDSNNVLQDWSADQIGLAVMNMGGLGLRLAFINACRSGNGAGGDGYSVARALFMGSTPSVIAMQADVSGKAAHICAKAFYAGLASGIPIDKALAAARFTLNGSLGGSKRHPYVPVLNVRSAPEQILAPARAPATVITAPELDDVRKYFVDRLEERSALLGALFDTGLESQRKSVVVIRGSTKIGKTWMSKWLLHACAATGMPVYRLEVLDQKDWLEVLFSFCEGKKGTDSFARPLPPEARAVFYKCLSELTGVQLPVDGSKPDISLSDLKHNEAQDKVMSAFHRALKVAAGTGNLVIAFDRLRESVVGLQDAHFASLKQYLWETHIASEPDGPVKAIVMLPGKESDRYEAEFSNGLWTIIDLKKFSAFEVKSLICDVFAIKYPEKVRGLMKVLETLADAELEPGRLLATCDNLAPLVPG